MITYHIKNSDGRINSEPYSLIVKIPNHAIEIEKEGKSENSVDKIRTTPEAL